MVKQMDKRTLIIWVLGFLVIIESVVCFRLALKKREIERQVEEQRKGYLSNQVREVIEEENE